MAYKIPIIDNVRPNVENPDFILLQIVAMPAISSPVKRVSSRDVLFANKGVLLEIRLSAKLIKNVKSVSAKMKSLFAKLFASITNAW